MFLSGVVTWSKSGGFIELCWVLVLGVRVPSCPRELSGQVEEELKRGDFPVSVL